jgi:hypothetical protein
MPQQAHGPALTHPSRSEPPDTVESSADHDLDVSGVEGTYIGTSPPRRLHPQAFLYLGHHVFPPLWWMRVSRRLRLQRWKAVVPEDATSSLLDTGTTCPSRLLFELPRQLRNRVHPRPQHHYSLEFDSLFVTRYARWPIPLAYGASILIVHHLTPTHSCLLMISHQLVRLKLTVTYKRLQGPWLRAVPSTSKNPTVNLLLDWQNTGSELKSNGEVNKACPRCSPPPRFLSERS